MVIRQKVRYITLFLIIIFISLFLLQCSSAPVRRRSAFSYNSIYQDRYKKGKGGIIPLTIERGEAFGATVSPDGKYLFFSGNKLGNYDIFIRDLTDVEVIPIVKTATNQKEPAISPDAKHLVYIDDELDPDGDLVLRTIKPEKLLHAEREKTGSGKEFIGKVKYLTNDEKKRVRSKESNPVWSSDSKFIAFASDMNSIKGTPFGPGLGAIQNIWILPVKNPLFARKITKNGGVMPSFSPNNKKIIYVSYQKRENNGDIYEVNIASGKTRQITTGKYLDLNPSYSLNGRHIILTRISQDTNGDGQIDRKDFGQIIKIPLPDIEIYLKANKNKKPTEIDNFLKNQQIIPLTLSGQNIFDTRTSRFIGGSILFAYGQGADINVSFISIISIDGIIPKKPTIVEQFQFSLEYKPESLTGNASETNQREREINKNTSPKNKNDNKNDNKTDAKISIDKTNEMKRFSKEVELYFFAFQKFEDFFKNDPLFSILGPEKEIVLLDFLLRNNYNKEAEKIHKKDHGKNIYYKILLDLYVLENKKKYPKILNNVDLYFEALSVSEYINKIFNSKVLEKYFKVKTKEVLLIEFIEERYGNTLVKDSAYIRLTSILSGQEKREFNILFNNQENRYKSIISNLKEKIALDLEKNKKFFLAEGEYVKIIVENPEYYRAGDILFHLGDLNLSKGVSKEFLFILYPNKYPYEIKGKSKQELKKINAIWQKYLSYNLKDKVQRRLFNFFLEKLNLDEKILIDNDLSKYSFAQHRELHFLANLAMGEFYSEKGDYKLALAPMQKIKTIRVPNTIWDFYFMKIYGTIRELLNQAPEAYFNYYNAVLKYQAHYKYQKIESFIKRLLSYYERNVIRARKRGDFKTAWGSYKFLMTLYLDLYGKNIARKIVNEKALKTFIEANNMILESVRSDKSFSLVSLIGAGPDLDLAEDVQKFYDSKIYKAQKQLNNSFIFARAYLNSQLGLFLQNYYESAGMSSGNKEDILKLFKKAEQDLRWSFFANPYFANSYLMLGWMYQFIDEKREIIVDLTGKRKDKEVYESLYKQYFPNYLFEENIQLYQKSISLFKDNVNKNILVSLYLNIANNYFLLNNYVKAEENFEKVLENKKAEAKAGAAIDFENVLQEASFYFHLGKTYYFTGKYKKSVEYLLESLKLYETLAPITATATGEKKGIEKEQLKENQLKRETLLKYLALSSEYAEELEKSIKYYKRILKEQNLVGIRTGRSLIFLELSRLSLDLEKFETALVYANLAENYIESEDSVEIPKFKVRILWKLRILSFFDFNIYDIGMNNAFVGGSNKIVFILPTIHRRQYVHSIKASIYKKLGILNKAKEELNNLINVAEDDSSNHGKETLNNAYMRLGEIEFLQQNLKGSEKAFEKALEIAKEREDFSLQSTIRKNLFTLVCYDIEYIERSKKDKRAEIKIQLKAIDSFEKEYFEAKLELKKDKIEEAEDRDELKIEEIQEVKENVKKEISRVIVFKSIFKNYLADFNLDENKKDNKNLEKDFFDYINKKRKVYNKFKNIIKTYSGYILDEKDKTKEIKFINTQTDHRILLILGLNKGRVYQKLSLLQRAKTEFIKVNEKSVEFQTMLPLAVSNFRLFQINIKLKDITAITQLLSAYRIFNDNPHIIKEAPLIYKEIISELIKMHIKKGDFNNAILMSDRYRHQLALETVKNEFDISSVKLKRYYDQYNEIETVIEELEKEIEKIRLRRGDSSKIEAELALTKKEKSVLKLRMLRNPSSRAFAKIILTDSLSLKDIEYFNKKQIYILKGEFENSLGYHFWRKSTRKLNPWADETEETEIYWEHKFFPLEKIEKAIKASKNFSGYRQSKLQSGVPVSQVADVSKSSKINIEKLAAKYPFIRWIKEDPVDIVFPDGIFWKFPFEIFFDKPVIKEYTITSAILFQKNKYIAKKRLLKFIDDNQKKKDKDKIKAYPPEIIIRNVSSLKKWKILSISGEVLDYQTHLEQGISVTNTHKLLLGKIFATENYPSTIIVTYNDKNKISLENKLKYIGGLNLIAAARGATSIFHSLNTRKKSSQKIYNFLSQKSITTGEKFEFYSGNLNVLTLYNINKKDRKNDKFNEIKNNVSALAVFEKNRYYRKALSFARKRKYFNALQAINRSIDSFAYEQRLEGISDIKSKLDLEKHIILKIKYLFLTGKFVAAKQEVSEILLSFKKMTGSTSKSAFLKSALRIWSFYVTKLFDFGLEKNAYKELTSKATEFKLNEKHWKIFIESYYLRKIKAGKLSAIAKSLPQVFKQAVKKYDIKIPALKKERIVFFTEKSNDFISKRRSEWVKALYESLELNAAFDIYISSPELLSYKEKLLFLLTQDWATVLVKNKKDNEEIIKSNFTTKLNTLWLDFLKNPGYKKLNNLLKFPLKEELIKFAYAKYYFSLNEISQALENFSIVLDIALKNADFYLSDNIFWSLIFYLYNRTHSDDKNNKILQFLSEYGLKYSKSSNFINNLQRKIFYNILAFSKDLKKNPEDFFNFLEELKVKLKTKEYSTLNLSLINRFYYLGASYKPEEMIEFSYNKTDQYNSDIETYNLLMSLKKQASSKEKFKPVDSYEEMKLLFNYFYRIGSYFSAMKIYFLYDKNKFIQEKSSYELPVNGILKLYAKNFFYWSWIEKEFDINPLKALNKKTLIKLFYQKKEDNKIIFYLPAKEKSMQSYSLPKLDNMIFTTTVSSKKIPVYSSKNIFQWTAKDISKDKPILSIFNIILGTENKEDKKSGFILLENPAKTDSIITVWGKTLPLTSISSYLIGGGDEIAGWNIIMTKKKADSVYLVFLKEYLNALHNRKAKNRKGQISIKNTYFLAKMSLKRKFPQDYNSIILVRN